jgi:hypothetical protein
MQHFVIVGILVIVMTVLTYFGLDAVGLAKQMHPVAASAQAVSIDQMWNLEMIVISFLFSLIVAPMVYSLVAFRRKQGDTTDARNQLDGGPVDDRRGFCLSGRVLTGGDPPGRSSSLGC